MTDTTVVTPLTTTAPAVTSVAGTAICMAIMEITTAITVVINMAEVM